MITSPSDAFTDAELGVLNNFVADGGLVVLHEQSDFSNFDQTDNLNAVADAVGAGFRFNDGEVGDTESNVGIGFLPLTSNFNGDFPLFADRPRITIDLRRGRDYEVDVDGVADGDTFDVVFGGDDIGLETDFTATVRVFGIDTPESASVAAAAERPEEWEGLAYDIGDPDPFDELGTRLRVGDVRVTDAVNNVADSPDLPTATDVVGSPEPPRNPGRNGGNRGNSDGRSNTQNRGEKRRPNGGSQ